MSKVLAGKRSMGKFEDALIDVLPVSSHCALLFLAAAIYDLNCGMLRVKGVLLAVLCTCVLGFHLILIFKLGAINRVKAAIRSDLVKWGMLAAVLAALPRLYYLSAPLYWDSGIYYYGLGLAADFNSSFKHLIHYGAIAHHPSWAYTSVLLPGYLLYPEGTEGVNLVRLLLYSLSTFCTFALLKKSFPAVKPIPVVLASLFVSFAPMGLGTFSSINLDWPLMVFLPFVLFSLVYRRPVLLVISSLCLVFSKEPGIVLLVGIGIGYLIYLIKKSDVRERKKIKKDVILRAGLVSIALSVILYLLLSRYSIQWTGGAGSSTAVPSYFGWNYKYAIYKLYSMFGINFSWIPFCAILLFGAKIIKTKLSKPYVAKHLGQRENSVSCSLIIYSTAGAAIAFSLFSVGYITFNNPRYCLPNEYLLQMWFAMVFLKLVEENPLCYLRACVCAVAYAALLIGQSYWTIDPLMHLFGVAIPTGIEGEAVYAPQRANEFYSPEDNDCITYTNGGNDMAVYNGQLYAREALFDKVFADAGYKADMDIIAWGESYIVDCALSLEGVLPVEKDTGEYVSLNLKWDGEKKKRTLPTGTGNTEIKVLDKASFEFAQANKKLQEKAVLLIDPLTQRGVDGSNVTNAEKMKETIEEILDRLNDTYEIEGEVNWVIDRSRYAVGYVILDKR